VADPAVIRDETLDDPGLFPMLMRGVRGSFTYAVNGPVGGRGIFIASALLSDELVHSALEPGVRAISDGVPRDDLPEIADLWAEGSRARWTAEDMVRRLDRMIARAGEDDSAEVATWQDYLAESLIWAGYSNRVLGENFCDAVIDAGPLQPSSAFFERAREQFTRAREIAAARSNTTLERLAIAGRAQVNMLLGDWAAAVADAALVPTDFNYRTVAIYPSSREANGFRTMSYPPNYWLTVWGTPFATWGRRSGTTTGDPRVPYTISTSGGQPLLGLDQRRPFVQQLKYAKSITGISLAKGVEMRLIEAEAKLVAGDWQGALESIQAVRAFRNTSAGGNMQLPAATAASADEAWTLLMKERGIELWLEGRRVGDLRRWAVTPGSVLFTVVREAVGSDPANDPWRNVLDVPGELCLPVSRAEKFSNPTIAG